MSLVASDGRAVRSQYGLLESKCADGSAGRFGSAGESHVNGEIGCGRGWAGARGAPSSRSNGMAVCSQYGMFDVWSSGDAVSAPRIPPLAGGRFKPALPCASSPRILPFEADHGEF